MKNLFAIKTPVRFDTPEYNQFHCDLIQYIYENHFEESDEWKIISRNLVYTSTQRMAVGEGNTILIQLDALKRRELGLRFAVDWKLVHLDIIRVARSLYQDGHYFESARSAFIEINQQIAFSRERIAYGRTKALNHHKGKRSDGLGCELSVP